ncbi:unnamed protein product [Ixodes persulcatus]
MAKPLSRHAKKTQRDDLSFFVEGRLTDVEFLVEDGSDAPKVFRAHKMMLAIRNEVFEAMFYGNLPEKDQVRITDLHPDGFSTFLKYLYSRKASFVNIQQALHTRTAAQKYMESMLVEDCDTFIQKEIKPTNVCSVLDHSVKYGSTTNLDDFIDKHVEENAGEVLKSEAFITASRESVMRILKNPRLKIREHDIIKRVYAWALAHCRQETDNPTIARLQQIMRPFLPELRFLALTSLEFVEGPSSWNIMTKSETLAVLSNIIKPGSEKLPEVICKSTENRTVKKNSYGQVVDDFGRYRSPNNYGTHQGQYCPYCGR